MELVEAAVVAVAAVVPALDVALVVAGLAVAVAAYTPAAD